MRQARRPFLAVALMALPLLSAGTAAAQVSFGIGIGPAYPVYPYPYAYPPPPAWYVPPFPAYAPPPAYVAPRAAGQACYAGAYICPLERPVPAGDACACPARNGGRAWGRVG
ncbi:hypothetical protein J8J14_03235 [Roseomonas sp. SSH11]|uniref:Uncharacterized protein n=1 Tax=Pararoseomonas baculiformis TaxID=2820812 RepID=A0ABS4ABC0_9PROT|nr:hypothetical protein [Pararoseomonas baculiformis]MBP0443783.1 hypothetical protein [Pararoseomonas baculiformis]